MKKVKRKLPKKTRRRLKKETADEFLGRVGKDWMDRFTKRGERIELLKKQLKEAEAQKEQEDKEDKAFFNSHTYFDAIIESILASNPITSIPLFEKKWTNDSISSEYRLLIDLDFLRNRSIIGPNQKAFFEYLNDPFFAKELLKKYQVELSFFPMVPGKSYPVQNGYYRGDTVDVTPYSQRIHLLKSKGQ